MDGDIVGLDTCEGHIRSVGHLDSKDADEFGDWFPEGEPCSVKKPGVQMLVVYSYDVFCPS